MEQYLDAKVKRYVQKKLFQNVWCADIFIGLAGSHWEEYLKTLPERSRTILVDYNPTSPKVRRNSLVGEVDLQISKYPYNNGVNFVDCDFCKTITTCGDDLLYIYNKMKRNRRKIRKYISFTFSVRMCGKEETINWLVSKFPQLMSQDKSYGMTLSEVFDEEVEMPELHNTQCIHRFSPYLYGYIDSGAYMISGIILF